MHLTDLCRQVLQLEDYLASELDDTAWVCCEHFAVRRVIGIVVNRRAYARSSVGIVSILSVVEYVERFSAELESNSFRKLEVLADAHIPVVDTRPAKDVTTAVSKLAGERLRKACSVEKFIDALVEAAVGVATRDQVGPLGKGRKQSELSLARMEYGNPFWKVVIPVTCQPPIARSAARFMLPPKRLPLPTGNW